MLLIYFRSIITVFTYQFIKTAILWFCYYNLLHHIINTPEAPPALQHLKKYTRTTIFCFIQAFTQTIYSCPHKKFY